LRYAKLAKIFIGSKQFADFFLKALQLLKNFATQDNKIFKQAVPVGAPRIYPGKPTINAVEMNRNVPNAGKNIIFTPNMS
jgi:hypothetical protein